MRRHSFVGFMAIILTPAVYVWGQGYQGGARGGVLDPGGAVIPGVEVSLVNTETNAARMALANEQGQYVFSAVTSGLYKIKASLPGFKTYERQGIRIGSQEFPIIDITLEVGIRYGRNIGRCRRPAD